LNQSGQCEGQTDFFGLLFATLFFHYEVATTREVPSIQSALSPSTENMAFSLVLPFARKLIVQ